MRWFMARLAATALLLLVLSGCGSSSPQDVAVDFTNALKKGDIPEAKELATKKEQAILDTLAARCILEESRQVLKKLDQIQKESLKDEKKRKELQERFKAMRSKLQELTQRLKEDRDKIKDQYKKMSRKERRAVDVKLAAKHFPVLGEILTETMGVDVDSNNKQLVYIALGYQLVLGPLYSPNTITKDLATIIYNGAELEPIDPQCSQKYSDLEGVQEITPIGTEKKSEDELKVKLELVKGKGDSTKRIIFMEKVQGDWKVKSYGPLNQFLFISPLL